VSALAAVGRIDRLGAAASAVRLLGWDGVVLPELAFPERKVFPVVVVDSAAARERAAAGPCHDRALLSLWESWPTGAGAEAPPAVLRIVGFVAVGPVRQAVPAVARLRGYGAAACVALGERPAAGDVPGYLSVLRQAPGGLVVVQEGLGGPVATAGRTAAVRAREEALYAWALRHGAVDGGPARRTVQV
jgi:hypothetical protein